MYGSDLEPFIGKIRTYRVDAIFYNYILVLQYSLPFIILCYGAIIHSGGGGKYCVHASKIGLDYLSSSSAATAPY